MPSDNPKKTLRFPPELLKTAELYCKIYNKDFNAIVVEALEDKLAALIVTIKAAKVLGVDTDALGD